MFEFNPEEWLPSDHTQQKSQEKKQNRRTETKNKLDNPETATAEDVERLVQHVEAAKADIAPSYAEWRDLGFALCEALGENGREYFHRLSCLHNDYNAAETDKQYDRCLQSHGGGVTVKTLFYLAKQGGVRWSESSVHCPPAFATSPIVSRGDTDAATPAKEKELSPTFPQDVYSQLPDLLQQVVAKANGDDDADLLLLGSLTVISSCLPHVYGNYDERKVYPNLFLFVTAQASAGKGRLTLCHRLVEPIHRSLRAAWRQEMEKYEQQLSAFAAAKDKQNVERPQEPPLLSLFIPANSSATAVFQMLNDNKGVGLMFETEGDTLAQTFKSEHGNYSDGFRKAFHHETISYNRRKDREFVELESPRLSAVLSGTPHQIKSLVPDTENGLFSRFIFYYMNVRLVWKDVFACADSEPTDEYFCNLGQQFFALYQSLKSRTHPLRFCLQPMQQQEFNTYFEEIQKSYTEIFGLDILASVRRLGLITYRIAMILSTLRWQEAAGADNRLVCSDTDFQTALSISKVLIQHTAKVYQTLATTTENSPYIIRYSHKESSTLKDMFFERLPVFFNRKDYVTVATDLGIASRTADRYINSFVATGRLQRKDKGEYEKK